MPFASYTENILERLNEAQNNFREELQTLRNRLAESDLSDRQTVGADIRNLKTRLDHFLDELDSRTSKLFVDARARLTDRDVSAFAVINKKEGQLDRIRKQRDDAMVERDQARKAYQKLRSEKDALARERQLLHADITKLQGEIADLKRQTAGLADWKTAVRGVSR
jgi:chromosome segregation ATPase